MKENGFTLIELLGVIIVLAMLGVVIIPFISDIISDNKKELYDVQIRNIKSGASNFMSENVFNIEIASGSSLGIRLGKLKELGYVDNDVYNPITRNKFNDDMLVIINYSNSAYSYIVCDGSVVCDSNVSVYGE